jgi:hypothetical protein
MVMSQFHSLFRLTCSLRDLFPRIFVCAVSGIDAGISTISHHGGRVLASVYMISCELSAYFLSLPSDSTHTEVEAKNFFQLTCFLPVEPVSARH